MSIVRNINTDIQPLSSASIKEGLIDTRLADIGIIASIRGQQITSIIWLALISEHKVNLLETQNGTMRLKRYIESSLK